MWTLKNNFLGVGVIGLLINLIEGRTMEFHRATQLGFDFT
jgi:hypothetical protein